MKKQSIVKILLIMLPLISAMSLNKAFSQNQAAKIKSENLTYTVGDITFKGYLAYKEDGKAKKPGILVVHEWWGLNYYAKMRADMLAALGYVALAVDMYGDGLELDNPKDAQENATKIYTNPTFLKDRMMAAYTTLTNNKMVDGKRIAAIGYCFGGTIVLNSASMGIPLKAVASFHGGLAGFKASLAMQNTKVLICNGGADKFVSEADVNNLKSELKNANVTYEFKSYAGATHAFTNKESTAAGIKFNMPIAYNEEADKASWQDMINFFQKYFLAK